MPHQIDLEKYDIREVEGGSLLLTPKPEEPKPWPQVGDYYRYLAADARSLSTWSDHPTDLERQKRGIYKTPRGVELADLRRQSMVPSCPMPQVGEECIFIVIGICEYSWTIDFSSWDGDVADRDLYNQGRVFRIDDEAGANAWTEKFGDAWTEVAE